MGFKDFFKRKSSKSNNSNATTNQEFSGIPVSPIVQKLKKQLEKKKKKKRKKAIFLDMYSGNPKDESYVELDYVVAKLTEQREQGKNVYVMYQGHKLHSVDIFTIDDAYKELYGCTKASYENYQRSLEKAEESAKHYKELCDEMYALSAYIDGLEIHRTEGKVDYAKTSSKDDDGLTM